MVSALQFLCTFLEKCDIFTMVIWLEVGLIAPLAEDLERGISAGGGGVVFYKWSRGWYWTEVWWKDILYCKEGQLKVPVACLHVGVKG